MRIALISLLCCAIAYALLMTWLYLNQRNLMYYPKKEIQAFEHYSLKGAKEITLTTTDGIKLQAWYRKAKANKPMVIFLHGNAGNLEDRIDKLNQLITMGYGFITPSWRGYGKSDGTPTMQGLYFDAEAAIDYARTQGYKIDQIIMIGESLGAGIATEMATRYQFKGLFLITPYTSISKRAEELYPIILANKFTKDNFNVIDKIAQVEQPILIIHGTNDKIIPHRHSENIFAIAKEPKKLIIYPNIGHVDYNVAEVFTEMDKFFTKGE